jgi:outer membrane receptor protein involved in Fe transport
VSATSITLPNPYLKPEYALGREAGFDWQPIGWAQLKGTWYVADYKDFNVPTTFATGTAPAACGAVATCRQRQNVSRSRSEGGELSVALRPIQQLFVSGGVNYDDARQQSLLPAGTTDDTKPHINRVPSPRQTIRATYTNPMLGAITALWKHEGKTTTLQGLWIDPFTVVDANIQRELMPGLLGFVSVENIGDVKFQVNTAAAAGGNSPQFFYGMPRTVRVGLTASR